MLLEFGAVRKCANIVVDLEKMLQSAYLPAKFGFDTAENDPAKNLQNVASFANRPGTVRRGGSGSGGGERSRSALSGLRRRLEGIACVRGVENSEAFRQRDSARGVEKLSERDRQRQRQRLLT